MVPGQKNIILRYTLIMFIMALLAIAIIAKAAIIMFAERQYWRDVARPFHQRECDCPSHQRQYHFCRWEADGQQSAGV